MFKVESLKDLKLGQDLVGQPHVMLRRIGIFLVSFFQSFANGDVWITVKTAAEIVAGISFKILHRY